MSAIYQIKIQLERSSQPPVWRQLKVASTMNLYLLHCCIQGAMGWFNTHLHQFRSGGDVYGVPNPIFNNGLKDERKAILRDILKEENDQMAYEYDFGNSWLHSIVLEKILPSGDTLKLPILVQGRGACPPEDCDGIEGFDKLKEVMRNPNHPEFEELSEWLEAETFDGEAFDLSLHQEDMLTCYKNGLTDKG
jgi:Plasmid pRiA4b ORF-3-like protein